MGKLFCHVFESHLEHLKLVTDRNGIKLGKLLIEAE